MAKLLGRVLRTMALGLVVLGTANLVFADGDTDCERRVGEGTMGGATVYKDTGTCDPDDCPGVYPCTEVGFPGIPQRFICMCGPEGNACTVMFHGQAGQTGSVTCFNNSCTNACPTPQQKVLPGGGYDTFTWRSTVFYVLTCPCPD